MARILIGRTVQIHRCDSGHIHIVTADENGNEADAPLEMTDALKMARDILDKVNEAFDMQVKGNG